jgi:hypothetical protein
VSNILIFPASHGLLRLADTKCAAAECRRGTPLPRFASHLKLLQFLDRPRIGLGQHGARLAGQSQKLLR